MNGASISARHFAVMGENREDVWLDNQGIPVMFRTVEDGTPIDFMLQSPTAAASANTVASVKRPALARRRDGAK